MRSPDAWFWTGFGQLAVTVGFVVSTVHSWVAGVPSPWTFTLNVCKPSARPE
jgi:hypothetical protein